MKRSSILLIVFGLLWILLGDYYFWLENDSRKLSFEDYPVKSVSSEINPKVKNSKNFPVWITIEDLDINLPVIPAKIEDGKWETTHDGASYLISSPVPGDKGNSVIYGHNWTKLFGNLVNAKSKQDIKIGYKDGSQKRFVVYSTSTVSPSDSSVLAQTKTERITLYTCTGFLDTQRFVVAAYLDKNPSFTEVRR